MLLLHSGKRSVAEAHACCNMDRDAHQETTNFIKYDVRCLVSCSICVSECPVGSNSTLEWVCVYPNDPRLNETTAWASSNDTITTLQEWKDVDYDYFDLLSDSFQNTSIELRGPCYPRLLESDNLFWSCQYIGDYVEGQAMDEWNELAQQSGQEVQLCDAGPAEEFINDVLTASGEQLDRYIAGS